MKKNQSSLYAHVTNFLAGCFLIISCSLAMASNDFKSITHFGTPIAPASIAGMDINLSIENTETTLPNGYATQGVAVMHYKHDGTWISEGTGGEYQNDYHGTYRYQRTSFNTAVEKSIDTSLNNAPYTTKFTFETPTSGRWVQNFANGLIIFSGSFSMVPSNLPSNQHLAPVSNTGIVALIVKTATSTILPAGSYPTKGLAVQTYSDNGSLTIQGFGPGMLNSTGTFKYTKVSANTAVEEVTQVSPFFTLPYTMVYTFETPTSGKWVQNLGNGFLKFSGTFDTFPK